MYDYRQNIKSDILDYIQENYTAEEIREEMADRDEWEQRLNDDLFVCDSVTGNASGSYYCNAWRAEEALCHNWDLLSDALSEFGHTDRNPIEKGAEWCDVSVRCYLLGECLAAALDELENGGYLMAEYFTVQNCTDDQLDELRAAYFWADDTDPETLTGIYFPGDVPNWLLFQQYAGIMFTNDDFSCSMGG